MRLSFIAVIITIVFPIFGFTDYEFKTLIGKNPVESLVSYETNGPEIDFIYSNKVEMHHDLVRTENMETTEWDYIHFVNGTKLKAVKTGGTITVTGSINGKSILHEYTNIRVIWDRTMIVCWLSLVDSGKTDPIQIVSINPDNGELFYFDVKIDKIENIDWNGSKVETYKTIETIKGVPALLYNSRYWIRKSDGVLIRFEGLRGSLGSPWIVDTLE